MADLRRKYRHQFLCLVAFLIGWCAVIIMAQEAIAESSELRVMSFNVRRARTGFDENATENNWKDAKFPRRDRAIRVIREYSPDLLGLQEARQMQIVDFREALRDYAFTGVG